MNDDTFLMIFRYALGLTGLWMVWMVIKAFRGIGKTENPKDDSSSKGDSDPMDKS